MDVLGRCVDVGDNPRPITYAVRSTGSQASQRDQNERRCSTGRRIGEETAWMSTEGAKMSDTKV
jgi:hypothetical protein